jgi:hypothetical protein
MCFPKIFQESFSFAPLRARVGVNPLQGTGRISFSRCGMDEKVILQNLSKIRESLQNQRKSKTQKEYIKFLELVVTGVLAGLPVWIGQERASVETKMKQIARYAEKFRGKKVLKENTQLYQEILEMREKLNKEGADVAWSIPVRMVATKHRKRYKTLYPNFMKWKNSLYAKAR